MSQIIFRESLNLNGNEITNFRIHTIQTGDTVPSGSFGKAVIYDGNNPLLYPMFNDGAGLYIYNGTLWEKQVGYDDTDVNATANTIARRDASGYVFTGSTPTDPNHAVSLAYLNQVTQTGVRIQGSFEITAPLAEFPKASAGSAVGGIQVGDGSETGPAINAGDAWYVVNTGGLIGPSSASVEVGDLIIALVDNAMNVDAHWTIVQNNLTTATTTTPGVMRLASSTDVADRTVANTVTNEAMTPQLMVSIFNDVDWSATISAYGVMRLAENTDTNNRTNMLANTTEGVVPSVLLNAFNNITATSSNAGTAMLAQAADFLNRAAATANVNEITTPALVVTAFNNFIANTTEAGTVMLNIPGTDFLNRANAQANTSDAVTPEGVYTAFINFTADSTNYGTVLKYQAADLTNIATITAEDSDYITPKGVIDILNVVDNVGSQRTSISGSAGNVIVPNCDVTRIRSIYVVDNNNIPQTIGIGFSNSGPNVDIAWTSSPSLPAGSYLSVSYTLS